MGPIGLIRLIVVNTMSKVVPNTFMADMTDKMAEKRGEPKPSPVIISQLKLLSNSSENSVSNAVLYDENLTVANDLHSLL